MAQLGGRARSRCITSFDEPTDVDRANRGIVRRIPAELYTAQPARFGAPRAAWVAARQLQNGLDSLGLRESR
jgi:hypothetical protein